MPARRAVPISVVALAAGWVATAAPAQRPPLPPPDVRRLEPRVVQLEPRVVDAVPRTKRGGKLTVPSDVLFAFDRANLTSVAREVLNEAAARLSDAPAGRVVITGHTDAVGTTAYNLRLSERRALSVRRYLAGRVPRSTYRVIGRGEADPVAPNTRPDSSDNPDGRRKNRRVEIAIPR